MNCVVGNGGSSEDGDRTTAVNSRLIRGCSLVINHSLEKILVDIGGRCRMKVHD